MNGYNSLKNMEVIFIKQKEDQKNQNPEDVVKKFYESFGYTLHKSVGKINDIRLSRFSVLLPAIKEMNITGMPDFFCYRVFKELKFDFGSGSEDEKYPPVGIREKEIISDFFFIEVKGETDSISMNQLKWYVNHPDIKKVIACVEK